MNIKKAFEQAGRLALIRTKNQEKALQGWYEREEFNKVQRKKC